MRVCVGWWASLLGSLLIPFALAIATYQLAFLVPGMVKVSYWEKASSVIFIAAVLPILILLVRSSLHVFWRFILGLIGASVLLIAAFLVQVHSTCEERPIYIGIEPTTEQVAACN